MQLHLDGALGQANLGHGVEGALRLGAGDTLQRCERFVQLERAALERRQQLRALLLIYVI